MTGTPGAAGLIVPEMVRVAPIGHGLGLASSVVVVAARAGVTATARKSTIRGKNPRAAILLKALDRPIDRIFRHSPVLFSAY